MSELSELDGLSRDQLIDRARALGVRRAELLTRVELRDEIMRLRTPDYDAQRRERGWFGVARELLASVVDGGLNLPQAARVIRGPDEPAAPSGGAPVATVTLAEIYAGQGHVARALSLLDSILEAEPEHVQARILRERLQRQNSQERRAPVGLPNTIGAAFAASSASSRVNIETTAEAVLESAEPSAEEADVSTEAAAPDAVSNVADSEPPLAQETGAPAAMLERDAVAVIVGVGGRTSVYWELSAESRELLRRHYPDGCAVVRVLCAQPTWEGPLCHTTDIPASEPQGSSSVVRRGRRSVVRAALGWRAGKRFFPLAVASELNVAASSEQTAPAEALSWTPAWRGSKALSATEKRALAAERG